MTTLSKPPGIMFKAVIKQNMQFAAWTKFITSVSISYSITFPFMIHYQGKIVKDSNYTSKLNFTLKFKVNAQLDQPMQVFLW